MDFQRKIGYTRYIKSALEVIFFFRGKNSGFLGKKPVKLPEIREKTGKITKKLGKKHQKK